MATSSSRPMMEVDERERRLLAPYAMFSADSAGRVFPEADHPYRGPFQRDRDRILHSSAYRRLSGKMQVFTGEMGDYHRTRLTHTQEVATIARTLGRALMLNEDLIEALALMHDLGHPPYGHAGEDVLNECLAGHGGFSHNQFGLTIVQEIEVRYNEYPGLNLTREVLAGQTSRVDKQARGRRPLLEVQLVDAADSTTYDAHDTDDAIKLGLVTLDQMSHLALIKDGLQYVRNRYAGLSAELLRKAIVHRLVNHQVTSLLNHTASQLKDRAFENTEQVAQSDFLIGPAPELAEQKKELEIFLYENVYRHPQLIAIRESAQSRLKKMFRAYCENPGLIPEKYHQRCEKIGVQRMAVEYIAGMTDHFCEETYRALFPDV